MTTFILCRERTTTATTVKGQFYIRKCQQYIISFSWRPERFSIQYRKVITPTNHKKRKHNGPIRTRSKCMQPASSAGKHVRARHDWFWFCFSLVLRKWREFCEPITERSKAKPKQTRKLLSTLKLKTALNMRLLEFSPRDGM